MENTTIRAGEGTREHLVVIGNGMAGCRAVEELLAREPARYRVTIFGAEPLVNYNRIMLSPILAGEKTFDDIVINGRDWYDGNGIEPGQRRPHHRDRPGGADRHVARGREGRLRPAPDRNRLRSVHHPGAGPQPAWGDRFRDMKDVEHMLGAAEKGGDAVVIGGGLLGLEAAHGLSLRA